MLVAALLAVLLQAGDPTRSVHGLVVDASGSALPGARVVAADDGRIVAQDTTAADGLFQLDAPARALVIRVSAPGFADVEREIGSAEGVPLRIELQPRAITETVTVSSNPEDLRVGTPASATILGGEVLATAPAWTLDDQLRSVPGFSLFRRSSSRVANPTTQGVTLRGLAASGASRALVLADGVPLNDPFGGWVYWDRLPAAAIERVEVARGGAGDLYGSDALGGAIRVESADRAGVRLLADAGSDSTARASVYGGRRVAQAQLFGAAETFTTDGFVIVAPESRGPIDVEATSRHSAVYVGAAAPLPRAARATLRAGYFTEDRGNGTPFQTNATIVRQVSAGASGGAARGAWTARAYGASQGYDQTFSVVLAGRAAERPTSAQHVDTGSGGASGEWLRAWTRSAVLAGGGFRRVEADLTERALLAGTENLTNARQRTGSLFLQGTIAPRDDLTLAGGVRGELWSSRGRGAAATPDRDVYRLFIPRATASWRANRSVSLRGAVQGGYRLPTINELFRPFRVGNVLTQANPELRPEESLEIEGAALMTYGRAAVRVAAFRTWLDNAIVSVTLESSPQLILRQRQNAARIDAAGLEIEADVRAGRAWSATFSSAFLNSTFDDDGNLDGLRVPQVPRWQAAAGVQGIWSRATASLEWRFIGRQFDDDRNEFLLDRSGTINARGAWRVRRGLELFAAIENVLDEEQDAGRTPIRTVGLPRTARAGVRVGVWK